MTSPEPIARPPHLARVLTLLFGAHTLGLLVPLLTVPWLSRVLGPSGWVPVLAAQALAGWAILVLEFGFDLAGTRDAAQAQSPDELARTAATVFKARLLLTPLVATGVVAVALALAQTEKMVAATVLYVLARGLSPYWFFQGKQQLREATVVETTGKVLPAALVFLLVRSPDDGWRVIALQAVGSWIATLWLQWRVHAQHSIPSISTADALTSLKAAMPMFGARAASGLYLQANVLILSATAPMVAVASYGGAERIVRAAINLLIPVNQAVYPRISSLTKSDPLRALRETRQFFLGLVGLALIGAVGTAALAGDVVRLLLGVGYEGAVPVLRLLVLTIPLVTAGSVLGIYWALPSRRESLFFGAVVLGGVTNVVLALTLVPHWGAMGMAVAVLAAEASVAVVLGVSFWRVGVRGR